MHVSLFYETKEDAQDGHCTTRLGPEDILAGLEKRKNRKGVNFFFSN